jgi:hypothetical protein
VNTNDDCSSESCSYDKITADRSCILQVDGNISAPSSLSSDASNDDSEDDSVNVTDEEVDAEPIAANFFQPRNQIDDPLQPS